MMPKLNKIKTPKCPHCINPELQDYYPIGKMKKVYIRTYKNNKRSWNSIGYICLKHNFFLPFNDGPGDNGIPK